jgi:hypothetical protein
MIIKTTKPSKCNGREELSVMLPDSLIINSERENHGTIRLLCSARSPSWEELKVAGDL